MKYQSELINEILADRGHEKSSLHYESECVESWVEENKGAYPKLCDYQSEWLNYINENSGIGDFPYVTVTDVTKATFENVVPLAYQSAILKGNTLVNIETKHHGGSNGAGEVLMTPPLLKANTKYYIKVIDDEFNLKRVSFRTKDWTDRWHHATNGVAILTTPPQDEFNNYMYLTFNLTKNGEMVEIDNTIRDRLKWIICEYQEGMENWDIPYFEGMQSVKMPVLTTYNSNIFPFKEFIEGTGATEDKDYIYIDGVFNEFTIPLETDGNIYTLYVDGEIISNDNFGSWGFIYEDGTVRGNYLKPSQTSFDTLNKKLVGLKVGNPFGGRYKLKKSLLCFNLKSIGQQPFKSNILTTNEEVELRGIGEGSNRVEDELDCLTGEATQRVGEIVLDGSENWRTDGSNELYSRFAYNISGVSNRWYKVLSNKFIGANNNSIDGEKVYRNGYGKVNGIVISNNKLENLTVDGLKAYLMSNPITVQYELEESIVKTVDLKTINENGESVHFMPIEGTMNVSCSSETIQPTFDMSVPVEATTQNLASFINLEMEE